MQKSWNNTVDDFQYIFQHCTAVAPPLQAANRQLLMPYWWVPIELKVPMVATAAAVQQCFTSTTTIYGTKQNYCQPPSSPPPQPHVPTRAIHLTVMNLMHAESDGRYRSISRLRARHER